MYIYTLVKDFMPKFLNFYVKTFSFCKKNKTSPKIGLVLCNLLNSFQHIFQMLDGFFTTQQVDSIW